MCAVIIGNSTTVVTDLFPEGGIISVNFGPSVQVNRLWQLGSFSPYTSYYTTQNQLSITAYAKKEDGSGGSQLIDLTPSTSCADTGAIFVSVNPGVCGLTVSPQEDVFYVTGYSYSKDNQGFGQESWSFTSKLTMPSYAGTIMMLRGISTGQVLTGDGILTALEVGVVVNETDSMYGGSYIEGATGSVSAGQLALGEYAVTREVVVSSVGGSVGKADGYKGTASVSTPVSPIYI